MTLRWHYEFDLERYETEPRGAWVGLVWQYGTKWSSALLHTPTMEREDHATYDSLTAACEAIEALLLERVPRLSGTPVSIGNALNSQTSKRRQPTPEHRPESPAAIPDQRCPICHMVVPFVDLTQHLVEQHQAIRKLRPKQPPQPTTRHEHPERHYVRTLEYGSKKGKWFVRCVICDQVVRRTAMEMHIGVYHLPTQTNIVYDCNHCTMQFNHNDYTQHLKSAHPQLLGMPKKRKKK